MDSCNVPQPKAEKSTANSHQNGHQILHQLGGKVAKNTADKKSDSNSHRPRSVSDLSLHTFGHKSAAGQMVANSLERHAFRKEVQPQLQLCARRPPIEDVLRGVFRQLWRSLL